MTVTSTAEAQAEISKLLEELATFQEGEEQEVNEIDELKILLAWAYSKLLPYSFSKQEDALKMDEIKLVLMQ